MYRFQLKYKRPTEKAYGHTDVFINSTYVGYMMPDRSKHRVVGENWTFTTKAFNLGYDSTSASNRDKLIQLRKEQVKS